MSADSRHESESEEWFLKQLDLADIPQKVEQPVLLARGVEKENIVGILNSRSPGHLRADDLVDIGGRRIKGDGYHFVIIQGRRNALIPERITGINVVCGVRRTGENTHYHEPCCQDTDSMHNLTQPF